MAELHIVDVKHGNANVLVDGNIVTIIDVGLKQRLLQYLIHNNIRKIDKIIISHTDADHVGGLVDLLLSDQIVIKSVYINSDSNQNSYVWKSVITALSKAAESNAINLYTSIHTGTPIDFSAETIEIEVSSPHPELALRGIGGVSPDGTLIDKHVLNVVIRLKARDRYLVLLAGDINSDGLTQMQNSGKSIRAEILVFPHHGGNPGAKDPVVFTTNIFNMVAPTKVIFSVGDNSKHHPRREIINEIMRINNICQLLSTGNALPILELIESDPNVSHETDIGNIIFSLDYNPILKI